MNQVKQISTSELNGLLLRDEEFVLLDVRESWEFEFAKIAGAILMPLATLPNNINKFDTNSKIVCICHHGVRSYHAAQYIMQQGYKNILNLVGGIDAWSCEIDSTIPRY